MFIVVAYDISNDRRRTRLHKKLKSFGKPVQYSVFECILDSKGLERMQQIIRNVIDKQQDLVRYYFLCEACRGRIEALNGEITQAPLIWIV